MILLSFHLKGPVFIRVCSTGSHKSCKRMENVFCSCLYWILSCALVQITAHAVCLGSGTSSSSTVCVHREECVHNRLCNSTRKTFPPDLHPRVHWSPLLREAHELNCRQCKDAITHACRQEHSFNSSNDRRGRLSVEGPGMLALLSCSQDREQSLGDEEKVNMRAVGEDVTETQRQKKMMFELCNQNNISSKATDKRSADGKVQKQEFLLRLCSYTSPRLIFCILLHL